MWWDVPLLPGPPMNGIGLPVALSDPETSPLVLSWLWVLVHGCRGLAQSSCRLLEIWLPFVSRSDSSHSTCVGWCDLH